MTLRKQKIALRRGRQYLREISGDGLNFGLPAVLGDRMRSVIPWSRSFDDQNLLLAINTDPDQTRSAWVDLDANTYPAGLSLRCLYATEQSLVGQGLIVQASGDRQVVNLTVPPAGFVIYECQPGAL